MQGKAECFLSGQRMRSRGLWIFVALLFPVVQGFPAERTGLALHDCETVVVPGLRCGTYEVFENRQKGSGRRISLNIIVLPALQEPALPDPIFYLAGGPGEAAGQAVEFLAGLEPLRRLREIVVVDQRGTGKSNGLQCDLNVQEALQALTTLEFPAGRLRRCRDELRKRADLRWYSTPVAMDDLNEVRTALGYKRINLYGGSYGTRAALVYMRRHPETVRSVILRAIAPTDMRALLPSARHTQIAFDGMVKECAAEAECAARFPDLRQDIVSVLAHLQSDPKLVQVSGPPLREPVSIRITRDLFAGALTFFLAAPETARRVPLIVHRAAAGDYDPFARMAAPLGLVASHWSLGMTMSVLCTEDAPRIRPNIIDEATKGSFLGGRKVRNQLAACADWPRGNLPPDYYEHTVSEAPVLMISGEYDPVDGLELAHEAARHLPRAHHIVLPGGTHQPQFPGCTIDLAARFLDELQLVPNAAACAQQIRRPPFALH